jgi:hypothetical protein
MVQERGKTMKNDALNKEHLLELYRDKKTSELEEIVYLESEGYTEVALSAIKDILEKREDRIIGITHKYCSNCRGTVKISDDICKCGYNFKTPNLLEIREVMQGRKKKNRVFGLTMILMGGIFLILALPIENVSESSILRKVQWGIPAGAVILGIYALIRGIAIKEPTKTAFDNVLGAPAGLKNPEDGLR